VRLDRPAILLEECRNPCPGVVGIRGARTETTDDFVDIPTQRPQHLSLRVTRTLRRVNDRWRFASVQ
jgi:hypothetical protein